MTGSPATVVVGVDGSESALWAVCWAAAQASLRAAVLRVVHAFEVPSPLRSSQSALVTRLRQGMAAEADAVVRTAVSAATAQSPEVRVESEACSGRPARVLVEQSEGAALLVLGGRGTGGFSGLLAGSVSVSVAGRAECPVVIVPEAAHRRTGLDSAPVVVGVDGSPASEAALACAFDLAVLHGAPLLAVHTWLDEVIAPSIVRLVDWGGVQAQESALLAQRLAGWGEKYPDVEVDRMVTRDRPAHALVEQSMRARLVVVGSRGRGKAAGLPLGSVSRALLRHSHCPVALVRPDIEFGT